MTDLQLFGSMKEGETAKEFITRKPKLAKKLIKYNMETFEDKYRKQRWDAPCTTVFAHLEKDGNRIYSSRSAKNFYPQGGGKNTVLP